jgi:hypothetical protein
MRAVTRVFVELTGNVTTQTFAFTNPGQLRRQLAYELFGFRDDPWHRRHGCFLALTTDNFVAGRRPGWRPDGLIW